MDCVKNAKKVLCLGSVTVDVIVQHASSVPDPGVLRYVDNITSHVGGCAANAVADLAKLGLPVAISCKVGNDMFGDFIKKTLSGYGADISGIVSSDDVKTTVSVVCLHESGERSFLYNPASTAAYTDTDISDKLLAECDIVFVAGSLLLTDFDGAPCARILRKAREMGKMTVLDTAWDSEDVWLPKIAEALPELDLFMPSYDEATRFSGETEPFAMAKKLHELGPKNIIIKLGKDGALISFAGEEPYILPTYTAFKPVDSTGAGDSFCAGFLAGQAMGWDVRRSAEFANAVATHCIMAVGASTAIPTVEKVIEFMETHTAG